MKEFFADGMRLLLNGNHTNTGVCPGLTQCEANAVAAFHRSHPAYAPTPLLSLPNLAKELGIKAVYVKDESRRFGLNAFKGLGGLYAVTRSLCQCMGIDPEKTDFPSLRALVRERSERPVFVTATDGNHGKGVAWAAREYGCAARVFMPKGSSPFREAAIAKQGADVTVTDMNYDDTVAYAAKTAEEKGWVLVQDTAWEGYETTPLWVTQGYLTCAGEALTQLLEQEGAAPTHVFLQAGVGSFAAAILGYYQNELQQRCPKALILEPEGVDCVYRSILAADGKTRSVEGLCQTIMAGLNCGTPSSLAWPVLREHAFGCLALSDSAAELGMRRAAYPMGGDPSFVSGESAGVGLGALERICREEALKEIRDAAKLYENAVVLLFSTEGDTDPAHYKEVLRKKPL